MSFDLQTIWTATGLSAAAVVVGLVFGFIQSAVPGITNSGTFRNWALIVISAVLVGLAGITSGKTLSDPDAIPNILGGILVFIGLYNASKNAHGAGEAAAVSTANGSEITSPTGPLGLGTGNGNKE